jgi:hypothetical protein
MAARLLLKSGDDFGDAVRNSLLKANSVRDRNPLLSEFNRIFG